MLQTAAIKEKIMQVQNAVKKLEKAGFAIAKSGSRIRAQQAGSRYTVQFNDQGGSVVSISVGCEQNDAMIDYFPRTYCDSIAQAIKLAH